MLNSTKLGTTSIPKLLATMSAPAMLSMLVQSLYNIVDSIFVAQIGETQLTAVSLAYPIQMLVFAFAIGIAIGTSSLISRRLGEGKLAEASRAAQTGLFFALISSAFFAVFGYGISLGFLMLFTSDAAMLDMSVSYLAIVTSVSVGVFVELFCSRTMQSMGNMIIPMISQLIGAITNIILDPIMIFGLIGFPALGVMGAAIATVSGQVLSMIFMLIMVSVKKFDIQIFFKKFRLKFSTVKEIFRVGLPTMFQNAISSFLLTIMNAILIAFSQTAVAVYGVYYKLNSFVFMPCFGLNQGALPIYGYNYGAGNKKRFSKTVRLTLSVAIFLNCVGLLVFCLAPVQLLELFSASANMMVIGVSALRIISFSFPAAAVSITFVAMYMAIGKGAHAFIITLLRQFVLVLPFAVLLGQFVSLDALWASFAIGEYATAIIYIPLTVVIVNKMFAEKMKYVEDGFLTSPIVINSTIMGDEIPLPKEEKQKNFDSFSNAVKNNSDSYRTVEVFSDCKESDQNNIDDKNTSGK